LKEAVVEFNKAIRMGKGRLERTYYALGMAESALENWPAARNAFQKSLSIRPTDGEAWFDLAFVYLALRDHPNAAVAFRRSIEFRSVDAATGHNNLGVIMAMNFEFDKAEAEFHNALRLSNGRLAAARRNIEFVRSIGNGKLIAAADWCYERGTRALTKNL
jgi:Flp pilus assembly protein TadD